MALQLTSPAFADGGDLPVDFTCDGLGKSPALLWSGEPEDTKSFVLLVHDPDAPSGDFTHWLLYDLPADVHSLPEGPSPDMPGSEGQNSFDRPGWGAPCPPRGHGAHRYVFTLHALDIEQWRSESGFGRANINAEMEDHILDTATLMGRYERR